MLYGVPGINSHFNHYKLAFRRALLTVGVYLNWLDSLYQNNAFANLPYNLYLIFLF